MQRIAIIEDEPEARDVLKGHLDRFARERGEEFQTSWFQSAIDFEVSKKSFDLVFLDIQLPGINGMEVANLIRTYDEETPIIFVTNLAQYAVRGYEVDALDFIVKPVQYYDFRMRMDKALRHIRRNGSRKIIINTRDGMRVVPLADIVYVSNHNLVYRLYGGQEPLSVYGTLAKFETDMEGGPFARISNSCMVNMNHIQAIHGGTLVMDDDATLYFSRSKKKTALATITSFLGGSI